VNGEHRFEFRLRGIVPRGVGGQNRCHCK
jgi:hypothetical protein